MLVFTLAPNAGPESEALWPEFITRTRILNPSADYNTVARSLSQGSYGRAVSTKWRIKSAYDKPTAAAAFGSRDSSVRPGRVFISRK